MNTDRWQRLEELFHSAVDFQNRDERRAFLDRVCADDPEMRADLESLLETDPATTDPGRSSLVAERVRSAAVLVTHPQRQGQRIGQYQIIQEIGAGGMGLVYLAERADDQFHMRVAIKVAQSGVDSALVRDRFLRERQILASLDHPYIAKLLDGGATEEGLPYFVMDHVEGLPIHKYTALKSLTVREKLELFRKVCDAVAFAHQNLVVHLDLKPSNILVTADGTPKLLDFGIARLLDSAQSTHNTSALGGARVMTPDYAGPEQLRGEAVTTATDVYSLGAVLYQLLTGELPHRLEGLTPRQIEHTICDTEPQRPSERAPRSRRQLQGDLDNIVLTAMAKDPALRYGGAAQLDDELRRYLSGLPVRARAGSTLYRVRKFVWRNKLAAEALAAVFLALVGGLVFARREARVAEEQRHVADVERNTAEKERAKAQQATRDTENALRGAENALARAERASREAESARSEAEAQRQSAVESLATVRDLSTRYLFGYNDRLRALAGTVSVRKEMLEDGIRRLENLAKRPGSSPDLQIDLSNAYMRLGDLYGNPEYPNLGDRKAALDHYQKAMALVQEVRRRPGAKPAGMKAGLFWDETLLAESELFSRKGDMAHSGGHKDEALTSLAKGLAVAQDASSRHPGDERFDRALSSLWSSYDIVLAQLGDDTNLALAEARKSRPVLAKMVADHPKEGAFLQELALTYSAEGQVHSKLGDLNAARPALVKNIELLEEVDRRWPKNTRYQRNLMLAYNHMGDYLRRVNDMDGAMVPYRKMADIADAMTAQDRDNLEAKLDASMTSERLGALYMSRNNAAEAIPLLVKAVAGLQSLTERDPGDALYCAYLMRAQEELGDSRALAGEFPAAIQLYETAYALALRELPRDVNDRYATISMSETQMKRGLALSKQGDRAAIAAADLALAAVEKGRAPRPQDKRYDLRRARGLGGRALIRLRLGVEIALARQDLDEADAILAKLTPEERRLMAPRNLEIISEARQLLPK